MGIEQHTLQSRNEIEKNKDIAFYASLGRHTAYHLKDICFGSLAYQELISEDDLLVDFMVTRRKLFESEFLKISKI